MHIAPSIDVDTLILGLTDCRPDVLTKRRIPPYPLEFLLCLWSVFAFSVLLQVALNSSSPSTTRASVLCQHSHGDEGSCFCRRTWPASGVRDVVALPSPKLLTIPNCPAESGSPACTDQVVALSVQCRAGRCATPCLRPAEQAAWLPPVWLPTCPTPPPHAVFFFSLVGTAFTHVHQSDRTSCLPVM